MEWGKRSAILAGGMAVVSMVAWQMAPSHAQQGAPASTRFEFPIIESFDAKYLGDTPGHSGHGRLGPGRPDAALGDPVYRGDKRIGTVTGLTWDRSKESLQVEFDPEPFELDARGQPVAPNRVVVGDTVWIALGGSAAKSAHRGDPHP